MMIFNGRNRVTSPYGSTKTRKGHGGIDIVGDDDESVHCVAAGTVNLVQRWDGKTKTGSQSYGNLVRIATANAEYMYYAHLASIAVKKGDKITAGQIIGVMGSTGNSTAPHTHFEVRNGGKTAACRINPAPYCGVENIKGTFTQPAERATFPAYVGTSISIVDALKAVGAQSSYSYRKAIAAANGIDNYRGAANQNIGMLQLLKLGKLKKA